MTKIYSSIILIIAIIFISCSAKNDTQEISTKYEKTDQSNNIEPEVNLLYGDKHILTINTPDGWYKDIKSAQKIGLTNIFFPKTDSLNTQNYMYANGYDKGSPADNLETFISADLDTYQQKYPELTYKVVDTKPTGGITKSKLYSFGNLNDRYKEEILYAETETAVLTFVFSAQTKEKYDEYIGSFDEFINSVNYLGSDSKEILKTYKTK